MAQHLPEHLWENALSITQTIQDDSERALRCSLDLQTTAQDQGLALAIAQGTIPPALRDVRLLTLDIGALLAGASMRGEFESRLKSVIQEASDASQPVRVLSIGASERDVGGNSSTESVLRKKAGRRPGAVNVD